MKNWYSKFIEQVTEQGRNVLRLVIIFEIATLLALGFSIYLAVRTVAWQSLALVGAFSVLVFPCL